MTIDEAKNLKKVAENTDCIIQLIDTVAKTMIEAFENLTIEDVNMFQLGYSKAIDDFVNACKEDISCQTFGLHIKGIERIAEQLKSGGENENYNKEES